MNTFLTRTILVLLIVPAIFLSSCSDKVADQIKKEVATVKSQCPSDLGNGVVMKDVNFYEKDKVLEYVCSIASVESIDAPTIGRMKAAMVEALSGSKSGFGQLSVKIVLKQYGYKFRYIYQDTAGKKLCQIDITKDDLK